MVVVMVRIRTTPHTTDSSVPGLTLVAAGVAVAMTAAVLLGAVVANVVRLPQSAGPGIKLAGRRLLRVGIVLLGLKLVVRDVLALGYEVLALAVAAVVVTFVVTRWLGRVLGVGD